MSYFLYKNIRTGNFSITDHGKVVDRAGVVILFDVDFMVSDKGRKRVLADKVKNVHAKLRFRSYDILVDSFPDISDMREVTYNPYRDKTFIYRDTGKECKGHSIVICAYGKVWVNK